MDLASQLNKKLIVSFYGYDYENLPHLYTQYIPLYQKLFAQSKAIITEGKFGKETLIKLGCSPEKIYIIPLGVDLSNIPIKTKFKKKNELRLIQVSNFKEKKGHIYTLKALEIAVKIHPNISLTLVGDGPLHHEIQSLASKLQLSNHIHFIEQIPFSKLHDFLIDFDALIQPSIRTKDKDTEGGAPVIILDAQACGLPIISNFHADIPNITIQNKTAILTKEKDTEALAKSIIEFYEMDEENYLCFSSNAKNFIYENFESKLCSARLENLYHNL
jgi:colanic acid/amylovoran biosynthesis glycosyltransferase